MAFVSEDIDYLLLRVLNGTASLEDYKFFKEWLEEDTEHREYFVQIRQLWHAIPGVQAAPEEVEWALEDYRCYIRTHRTVSFKKNVARRLIPYAVAVVTAICICSLLLFRGERNEVGMQQMTLNGDTQERSGNIELKRGDGTRVDLTAENIQLETEADGTVVTRESERELEYKASSGQKVKDIYNELTIPSGERFTLTLADGTRVWMNSESVLRYPVSFNGGKREVTLSGEAYFMVAKDPARPFIVHTSNIDCEVLGTSFDVSVYHNEPASMILVEGCVKVAAGGQVFTAQPNQQVVLNEMTGMLDVEVVDALELTGWKDGTLVIREQTFERMLQKLERWYGVEFFNLAKVSKQEFFNGKFDREDISTAMEIISRSAGIKYVIKGKAVTISN